MSNTWEFRTIDTRTLEGIKEAERLHQQGWKIYSTGLYTIHFQRRREENKAK